MIEFEAFIDTVYPYPGEMHSIRKALQAAVLSPLKCQCGRSVASAATAVKPVGFQPSVDQYKTVADNDDAILVRLTQLRYPGPQFGGSSSIKNAVLLEGHQLISDAVAAGCRVDSVLFVKPAEVKRLPLGPGDCEFLRLSDERMRAWSTLVTPPGIMAIVQKPQVKVHEEDWPITVICDSIRLPDNVSNIIRSVAAAGVQQLWLTKGCVDVWSPKVLRGAMGTQFRLPIRQHMDWDTIADLLPPSAQVFMADHQATSDSTSSSLPIVPYHTPSYAKFSHTCLIVGGETSGVSSQARQLVSHRDGTRLNIPMSGKGVGCLNSATATAVCVFEMRRQCMLANDT